MNERIFDGFARDAQILGYYQRRVGTCEGA